MVNPKKKIKVLIGANDLRLAGVQRLVIDQLQLLDREIFEISLVVLMKFPKKETFDDLIPPDVRVHQLSFRGLTDVRQWISLFRILQEIKPDVVKTATFFSNTVFLSLKIFFGYAVVSAEHNTVSVKPLWQRIVDGILLPRSYTIVGDSEGVADFVSKAEHINRKKFTVIYNGVNLDAVAEAERQYSPQKEALRSSQGIPTNAYVFITVARLITQKNHQLMIEAFARLCTERNDAYLVIVGEGTLRDDLEALARNLNVEKKVLFMGVSKNVYQFYAIADCFLLTSLREGFCIAAMEGLAFGMPLVSTRVAGVSEYLKDGENGYFVDNNPEDIAKKLQVVMEMSLEKRKQFSESGKATAKEYSIARYGEKYNELFQRSVAGK